MNHLRVSKIPHVLRVVGLCVVWQMLCVGMVWATPVKSEVGAPPPPADNEIPPAPPAFRPYQRPQTAPPQQAPNSWYGSPEYRRWLQYRKRKSRRYRKYRRYLKHQTTNRVRFWWSTESGVYFASFSPISAGMRSMEFTGLVAGAQMGVRYRSLIMSLGAAMAFSIFDNDRTATTYNVGGTLARLSGSVGWALGRLIILESGVSLEYLHLKQGGSLDSAALLFPVHVGMTFRFPVGQRFAVGLRTLASFAYEPHKPSDGGFYFSVTSNLVFQTQ